MTQTEMQHIHSAHCPCALFDYVRVWVYMCVYLCKFEDVYDSGLTRVCTVHVYVYVSCMFAYVYE